MSTTTTPQARPLSDAVGAEITGIDISRRLDDDEVAFVRQVFDERGLVLFKDVAVSRLRQAYLCQLLIDPEVPTEEEAAAIAEQQGSFQISNKEKDAAAPFGRLLYHCDGMWSQWPYEVISLYAVEVQPPVVPTWYVSSVEGWRTLPDELRPNVEGRQARHFSGPEYVHPRRQQRYDAGELVQAKRDHVPSYDTDIVHTHPRTGQPLLFITEGMTGGIVGMDPDESEDLLDPVFAHLYASENRLELVWEPSDFVIWDNIAVQHARPNVATAGPPRTLQKIGLPMPEEAIAAALVATYDPVEAGASS